MAQANVVSITGKPRAKRHVDADLLSIFAVLKLARAEFRLEWAKADYTSKFCTLDEEYNSEIGEALDQISQGEARVAGWEPRSTLGCQVAIDSVIDILMERQVRPDSPLAEGPVLEMLINVSKTLARKDIKIKS